MCTAHGGTWQMVRMKAAQSFKSSSNYCIYPLLLQHASCSKISGQQLQMAPPRGKFMDVLEAVSSGSSGSDSEGEQEETASKKPKKAEVTLQDLQKAGYKSGPSVLLVKPPQEQVETNWNWSSGREAKSKEEEESYEDRVATRQIATEGAELTAQMAKAASEHAEWLREERKAEREQAAQERKQQSFNAKEKRKRETGQASRGKSYVEEEKRLQRQFGVYSGFDT